MTRMCDGITGIKETMRAYRIWEEYIIVKYMKKYGHVCRREKRWKIGKTLENAESGNK